MLRILGGLPLTALLAVFMPTAWMDAAHQWFGLGELPRAPIVEYLTRSLSLLYVVFGALWFFMASDVRRYAPLIIFGSAVTALGGVVLVGIDLYAGMPLSWILFEGPLATVGALVMIYLARSILPYDAGPNSSR